MLVADFLPQQVGEDGDFLPVEIRLERMAYRLVQEDSRAARAHHHRHLAALGLDGLEEDGGLFDSFLRQLFDERVRQEFRPHAVCACRVGVLDASVLLHDAECRERAHRPVVVVYLSLAVAEEDMRRRVVHRRAYFLHPSVQLEDAVVEFLQVGHPLLDRD